VRGFEADGPFQLLVQLLPPGTDPDQRGASEGWEATPHQRFERLLRESGVLVGAMLTDPELRLTLRPRARPRAGSPFRSARSPTWPAV
jgi:hypothetical protein